MLKLKCSSKRKASKFAKTGKISSYTSYNNNKIWQNLRRFSKTFCQAHSQKLGRVKFVCTCPTLSIISNIFTNIPNKRDSTSLSTAYVLQIIYLIISVFRQSSIDGKFQIPPKPKDKKRTHVDRSITNVQFAVHQILHQESKSATQPRPRPCLSNNDESLILEKVVVQNFL